MKNRRSTCSPCRRCPETSLAREVESLLQVVDPQVLYRYSPLPAERNAWPLWKQAGARYVEQPKDEAFQNGVFQLHFDGPAPPEDVRQRIVDWVRRNDQCRKLVDQGIALRLEYPHAATSIRLPLATNEISLLRNLARLKGLYSRVLLNQREVDRALSEAASIVTMGSMLVRSECMIVDFLVAQAILGIGAQEAYAVAVAPGASEDQTKSAIGILAAVRVTNEDLKRAYRIEFCRWFLPFIAGIPQSANHLELATRYIAGDVLPDYKPSIKAAEDERRSIRQIAILLEGHPQALDKKATIRLGSQLHAQLFRQMDAPWIKRDHSFLEVARQGTIRLAGR